MGNRLNVVLRSGSGTISLSPPPNSDGLYINGDVITVTLTLDSGFTFVEWKSAGASLGTATTVVVTMGRRDIVLEGIIEGVAVPDFTYGLRLVSEYKDIRNRKTRLEVYEKNYVGGVSNILIDSLRYSIGNFDSSPVELFVTSSITWNYVIEKNNINLDFLLTNDPRKFKVVYYRGYVSPTEYAHVWYGYLKTSFFSKPEYKSTYKIAFTATDGIKDLAAYRTKVGNIDFTNAMTTIASLLKQTNRDPLPIKECVRVFEYRMNSNTFDSVWNQFYVNENFIYDDEVRFQAQGDQIVFNPTKKVLQSLETMLKSFVVRIFQWNGYWHIVRVFEYTKDNLKFRIFNPDGTLADVFLNDTPNDQEFPCIGNPERRGEDDFNEFNASLKLGSLNRPEERAIIVDEFGFTSWYNPNPGRPSSNISTGNTLRLWEYINAVQFDGVRDGDIARIEHVSNPSSGASGEFPRIWTTANGINDPNISGFSWRSIEYNSTVKNADTINFSVQFQCLRRGSNDRSVPLPGSHVAALQVKIGNSYLTWDGGVVFGWSNTPTKIEIPIENTGVFNTFSCPNVVVPEDGLVEFTLFQLVTKSGTRHRYIIDWDNVRVNLESNEALMYKEIKAKSITTNDYANEFPEYEIFLGDAMTNRSSAAMVLKDVVDNPVTESWFREDVSETKPLLSIVLQDLVNIFGKNNYSISVRIREKEDGDLDFAQGVRYKGKYCIILGANLDDRQGLWDFQLYELT